MCRYRGVEGGGSPLPKLEYALHTKKTIQNNKTQRNAQYMHSTRTITRTHTRARARTRTSARVHTHIYKSTHTYTHTFTHTHPHTHTHTRIHTHTHTHTQTHTNTHKRTQKRTYKFTYVSRHIVPCERAQIGLNWQRIFFERFLLKSAWQRFFWHIATR